jgi:hypothetical protein
MGPCRIAFSIPLVARRFINGRVAFVSARVTVLGLDRVGNEGQGPHAALELCVDPCRPAISVSSVGQSRSKEKAADGLKGRSCGLHGQGQASLVHFGAISLCLMPASDLA